LFRAWNYGAKYFTALLSYKDVIGNELRNSGGLFTSQRVLSTRSLNETGINDEARPAYDVLVSSRFTPAYPTYECTTEE